MKRALLTLLPISLILTTKAQKTDTLKGLAADTIIFVSVQKVPEFPGGIDKLYHFLMVNIRYPATAREHNTQGKVIISMVVEKDGSLSCVKVVRSVSEDLDNEALRVIKLSPKWNPGMQNGVPVRVAYSIPISFTLGRQ